MAKWYERIAEDPQGVKEEIAKSRGMSVEELDARRDELIKQSKAYAGLHLPEGYDHLSLNMLKSFNDSVQLQEIFSEHIKVCPHCTALLDLKI